MPLHLAVLLPRHLWKPDSQAPKCDSPLCPTVFTLLPNLPPLLFPILTPSRGAGRHHCRKCGGVFCAQCTSRTTSLLDTTDLPFFHPPPLQPGESLDEHGGVVVKDARVCDACWDMIWDVSGGSCSGLSSPVASTSSLSMRSSGSTSGGSAPNTSPCPSPMPSTPPDLSVLGATPLPFHYRALGAAKLTRPTLERRHSSITPTATGTTTTPSSSRPASLFNHPISNSTAPKRQPSVRSSHSSIVLPDATEPQLQGPLSTYPLRRSSMICKATGGGRWSPQPTQIVIGEHVPPPSLLIPTSTKSKSKSKPKSKSGNRTCTPSPVMMIADGGYVYGEGYRYPWLYEEEDGLPTSDRLVVDGPFRVRYSPSESGSGGGESDDESAAMLSRSFQRLSTF